MRAEFRIWHTGDEINYVMFKKGEKNAPIIIDEFPAASKLINESMGPLLKAIQSSPALSKKLFQIDFLSTSTNEQLITLLYHKPLDNDWENALRQLAKTMKHQFIGRARKQKIVLENDFVYEEMQINDCKYRYQQVENSFTQPNAHICQNMLQWATNETRNAQGDLLELYCGNGNFTIPLSKNYDKVLATEIAKTSVKSALHNIEINGVNNITIVRLSSEELTQALNKERAFRRLKNVNLDDYHFNTVFVDPPRSGIDSETLKLISQFDNIIYISCNPDTLHKNLNALKEHKIMKFALFDQFPFTDHIEAGVILKKEH